MITWRKTHVARFAANVGPRGSNLRATVERPAHPGGVVIIAHSCGDAGTRPRTRRVAEHLQAAGLVTACFELPEAPRKASGSVSGLRADTVTLIGAARWAAEQPDLQGLPIGLLVANGDAMGALEAASVAPELLSAVVVRGGHPEPAAPYLRRVLVPTLVIVGSRDAAAVRLNRELLGRLGGPAQLVTIPRAGQAFEEAGALEDVAEWAAEWFVRHLIWDPAKHLAAIRAVPLRDHRQPVAAGGREAAFSGGAVAVR